MIGAELALPIGRLFELTQTPTHVARRSSAYFTASYNCRSRPGRQKSLLTSASGAQCRAHIPAGAINRVFSRPRQAMVCECNNCSIHPLSSQVTNEDRMRSTLLPTSR
jgi:hypothetical protein